jgi:rfaE bifunctional protein nucleotidyltransferase chain/domain
MIITFKDLSTIRKKHKNQKIVLTAGTFDMFHVGHLNYLKKVKDYGDIVVLMLSGDKRVKARKGPKRPIISENERAEILDALEVVDYVFIDPSKLSPKEIDPVHQKVLNKLNPDYYVTDGPDPRFVNILDKSRFIIIDRMNIHPSTTAIIEYIKKL